MVGSWAWHSRRKRTEKADGAAGDNGGHRARLGVAHDAATGRQGGEDKRGILELLRGLFASRVSGMPAMTSGIWRVGEWRPDIRTIMEILSEFIV